MVRIDVYAMAGLEEICCAFCWRRQRADEGMRKEGGSKPQLRGALGGIVVVVFVTLEMRRWLVRRGYFEIPGLKLRFRARAMLRTCSSVHGQDPS